MRRANGVDKGSQERKSRERQKTESKEGVCLKWQDYMGKEDGGWGADGGGGKAVV